MRIAVLSLPLMLLCTACSMFSTQEKSEFTPPNSLMADEIHSRVQQIQYQHRDELLQNLMWLSQTGEPAIQALLDGLKSQSPKVRSSCAWALGRIHDRRTIPHLQAVVKDQNETVRLEAARALLGMGDLSPSTLLIEGLDSDKKEVRFLCHESLKASTGRDFGYDHLSDDEAQRHIAVLSWRQWWSDYSGDAYFAQSYQERHGMVPAKPMGEVQQAQDTPFVQDESGSEPAPQGAETTTPDTTPNATPNVEPTSTGNSNG